LECVPGLQGKPERQKFIIKVYCILFVQILVTVGIVTLAVTSIELQEFMMKNTWLYWASFGCTFAVLISLMCCHKLARKVPINYILLFIFTVFESYMVSAITIFYTKESIIISVGLTAALFTGLTLFACFTKTDFTVCRGLLWAGVVIVIFAIILLFVYPNRYVMLAICVVILLLLCIFVIYDTQQIANKGKYGLSIDDYIVGALLLYTDIITIFIVILAILGNRH